MTQGEFKAWFEGFSEAIGELPTKKQWARIKERAAEIDGKTVTERVYIDRYVDRYWPTRPYWAGPFYGASGSLTGGVGYVPTYTANASQAQAQNANAHANRQSALGSSYSSMNAMYALGKTEGLTHNG